MTIVNIRYAPPECKRRSKRWHDPTNCCVLTFYAHNPSASFVPSIPHLVPDFAKHWHFQSLSAQPEDCQFGRAHPEAGPWYERCLADDAASYTNFGRSAISVSAPGGDFAVTGNPFTSVVLAPCSSLSLLISCGTGSYLFLEGTSVAAPHVSGAAALLDAHSGGGGGENPLHRCATHCAIVTRIVPRNP